jgi:hypothetical protein
MKHVLLVLAILASCAAFVAAFAAVSQVFGITGKIDATKFALGPSWGWLAVNVVFFFCDTGLTAICFHLWMKG